MAHQVHPSCSSLSLTFQVSVPQIGSQAPAFTAEAVVNGDITEVSLAGVTGKGKWVVLFFYPLDFTFVCPTEVCCVDDHVCLTPTDYRIQRQSQGV